MINHDEILPHQKHDSHPILAVYGTDHFSIRIIVKGNNKKNNKTLHQQPRLLNDTEFTCDDVDHIYTRIPKSDSSFSTDTTLQPEIYSTFKKSTSNTPQESTSAINVQTNSSSFTPYSQIISFYDTSFFKYKSYFQGFFLPDDYSLDIKTLQQQQQSQDRVLTTVYSWILHNYKPKSLTPLNTGTPFLHAYYKRFSQLFIDGSTNLISLYITSPTVPNKSSTPDFVHDTIRICLPFGMFKIVFLNTPILVSRLHIIHSLIITTFHFLKNGFPFSYMTVLNVNVINTSIKKSKLLSHNCFQNMIRRLITALLWTLKDLSILLHTINLTYMSKVTLSVILLLQYPSNRITLKLQSKHSYTIGSLNLDHPYTLSLIVDQNTSTKKWHTKRF